jgi:hypothetical protein
MVRRRVGFGSAVFHQEDHHMQIASIGIDLGKTTFHLVALGERNKVLVRKKFSRATLLTYTANLPASLIGLEACAGAYARKLPQASVVLRGSQALQDQDAFQRPARRRYLR